MFRVQASGTPETFEETRRLDSQTFQARYLHVISRRILMWVRIPPRPERTCFLLLLCLSACLTSDPVTESDERTVTTASHVLRKTKAPLQLDPSILANRSFREAPVLAVRVRAGELPAVSQRLPEEPLVVVPMDEIGRYGGTIRRALTGDVVQTPGVSKTIGENIMGFEQPLPRRVLLNLAESYEFQDGGRTAIVRIRKGVKWSDGVPFTTDDILFWYRDMTLDADARSSPLFPNQWLVDGKPIRMEQVDAYTIRFRHDRPLGQILKTLAMGYPAALPKHYFAKYHPCLQRLGIEHTTRERSQREYHGERLSGME